MVDIEYLDGFENRIQTELVKVATDAGVLEGSILTTEDIEGKWKEIAPEYVADAVIQVKDYPTVSVAWASYLGLGIAYGWDADWEKCSQAPYKSYYGSQGFDNMDDHIVEDVLGLALDSGDAVRIGNVIRNCGEAAVAAIRHENADPQTQMAFHLFARTCKVMFRIGVSIGLKRLGYRFERVYLS